MRFMFVSAALLSLAGCSPAANEPVANQAEAPTAEAKQGQVPSLAGDWDVTALGSQPLQQVFPMRASFADGRLTVRSECVTFIWSYTQDRNIVACKPVSTGKCGRNQTTNENEMERAMNGANIALFVNDGREVQLSGNGGTATLTRR
jgi:hypothetical protein